MTQFISMYSGYLLIISRFCQVSIKCMMSVLIKIYVVGTLMSASIINVMFLWRNTC